MSRIQVLLMFIRSAHSDFERGQAMGMIAFARGYLEPWESAYVSNVANQCIFKGVRA
jgi:hypothetical protein